MQVVHGVPLGTKRRRRDESDKGGRGAASVPSGAAELLTTLFPSGADRAHIAADGSVTAEVRQRQVPASLAIAIADYRSRTERDDGGGSTNHVEGSEAAGEGGEAVPPPCPSELQHGRAESTQHFDLDYADPGVVTGWGRDDSGKVMHALYLYTRKQGPAGPRILLLHAATTGGDSSSYRSVKPVDARSVRDVRKLLGCTHVESKSYPREDHRAETGERFVMWTNDLGAASGQPPNRTATVLAGGSVVYGAAIVHSQAHVVVDDAKAHSSPLEKAERAWDQACRAADERSPRARLATDREMWMRTFSSARSFRPSFVCEGCDCPANATTLADFLRTKKLRCLCGAHNHNERLFFKFLRTACGMPDVQHHTLRVDRKYELDFHDPVERVAFELDGSHHFYGAQGDETAKRDLEKERLMSTEHEGVALVRVPDVGPEHGWWHDHALYVPRQPWCPAHELYTNERYSYAKLRGPGGTGDPRDPRVPPVVSAAARWAVGGRAICRGEAEDALVRFLLSARHEGANLARSRAICMLPYAAQSAVSLPLAVVQREVTLALAVCTARGEIDEADGLYRGVFDCICRNPDVVGRAVGRVYPHLGLSTNKGPWQDVQGVAWL